jgi:hypothetical protein
LTSFEISNLARCKLYNAPQTAWMMAFAVALDRTLVPFYNQNQNLHSDSVLLQISSDRLPFLRADRSGLYSAELNNIP